MALLDPAWIPDPATIARANVTAFAADQGLAGYEALHAWSVEDRAGFWEAAVERLGIVFRAPYRSVLDTSQGVEAPVWFDGTRLNIVESCFTAPANAPAIRYRLHGDVIEISYRELQRSVGEVASGLKAAGFAPGDRIAIAMPMTVEAVYAYLAIVAIGGIVVSIADSFATDEIATRLDITDATAVITQDVIHRSGRTLPMYDKVLPAKDVRRIVVSTGADLELAQGDVWWNDLLVANRPFTPHVTTPDAHTNVLFSSGTTGTPKAIPWTQLTPIKAAMDGHFHQDIGPGDVVAWPTNLGWMMGPWLIYASLVNGAALALHDDAPTGPDFGEFVAEAGVTMLGVVPSLVAAWRSSGSIKGFDWSRVRRFSSTGEASNAGDMRWLMSLPGGSPVIEYCGGTEIGGGFITGTMVQPAVPATFTTAALGLDLRILDEDGAPTTNGELWIVPPSIGLSTELLNRDHHEVYYEGAPAADVPLRRHGDHFEALPGGYFRAHGRIDDTMNLGGIKVGSAELERCIAHVAGVAEVAAVAVSPPDGGPSQLVVFAVAEAGVTPDITTWRSEMQQAIRSELNPLFKIHDVVVVETLPRTASAKVMRRELRAQYEG